MKLRKITSLTMFLSFTLLIITSIVLYVVPEGRVAYWSDWRFMGLTKTLWGDIHINLGVLFLFSGLLHLYYNWKPMVTYMKNRAKELKIFTPDFNVALAVTLIFTFGTLLHIPPMSTILNFSAAFKAAGSQKYGEPPYGHAELSSLKMFAKRTGLDLEETQALLKKSNLKFEDESWTLLDIARANNCTPQRGIRSHAAAPENNNRHQRISGPALSRDRQIDLKGTMHPVQPGYSRYHQGS